MAEMARVARLARKRKRILTRDEVTAWIIVTPWILGFLFFTLGPTVAAIVLSGTKWRLFSPPQWVGTANYVKMAGDPLVRQALKVTTLYAITSVPLRIALGLFVALLLNQQIVARDFVRTVYYLPACVSGVAVAMVWLLIFNGDFGFLNAALRLIGIRGPYWLSDIHWVLPSFVLMSLWSVGSGAIIYLAGLQGIPTDLYEAAEVDGAGDLTKFWHITLPMMSPVLFFQLVMGMIGSLQVFAGPFIMTGGGPGNASMFFMLHLYNTAFEDFRMGYACALAWVLFIYIMGLTLIVLRSSALWVYYEGEGKKR